MISVSLAYHDVVEDLASAQPIAPGHTTAYTIDRQLLREHLTALSNALGSLALCRVDQQNARPVFFTVDDGALSSMLVAEELERLKFRGHFFITTGWTGTPGFLNSEQVRELYKRGHLIGSHSHTHPDWMSQMSENHLLREWQESCDVLSDITGTRPHVASVPGGYYSQRVSAAASQAGINILFTSEPTVRQRFDHQCRVVGRYAMRRSASAEKVVAVAMGTILPRWREAILWRLTTTARKLGGEHYVRLRRLIFS